MNRTNYFIIIGLITVNLILYNRLFRIRLPRSLFDPITSIQFFCYIIIMVVSLILLIKTIILFYKKYITNTAEFSEGIMTKWLDHPLNPVNIIRHGLLSLDIYLKNGIPLLNKQFSYLDYFLQVTGEFCYKFSKLVSTLLFLLTFLPPLIVVLSFLADIFVFNKFYYFYKVLGFLIIPIIVNYYIYSLSTFVEDNLRELDKLLCFHILHRDDYNPQVPLSLYTRINIFDWKDIVMNDKEDTILCHQTFEESYGKTFHKDILSKKVTLNFCLEIMNSLFKSSFFITNYSKITKKISISMNLFKYLSYFLGWLYIIYTVLYFNLIIS